MGRFWAGSGACHGHVLGMLSMPSAWYGPVVIGHVMDLVSTCVGDVMHVSGMDRQ